MAQCKYNIRKLNILDIRKIIAIARDVHMGVDELRNLALEFLDGDGAAALTADDKALSLVCDSGRLWEFVADILGFDSTDNLNSVSIADLNEIVACIRADDSFMAFLRGL